MNEPKNKSASPSDEIHLLDFLVILAKHSRQIIYVTAAVTVLTYLVLFFLPNKFTATGRMLPPQQNLSLSAQVLETLGGGLGTIKPGGGAAGFGGMASSLLGLKSPSDLYVGMLTGNTISDRIIERFKLREYYKQNYIEDVRKELHRRAQISAGRDGMITINVTDESPQRAQEVTNAFMDELDRLLQNLTRQEAQDRLSFLEKKRSENAQNLSKAEENLRNFSECSSVLQIDAQTKSILEYIASLRATVDSKEVQLKVLREQATPFNYDLIKLETELKGLKEKLRDTETQESQNPKTCDAMIATSKMPALGLEYLRLYREAKFQEQLHQLYSKLVELARLDEVRAGTVHVVDRALPPEKRSNQRLIPAVTAGLGTFFLMVLLVFVGEYWQAVRLREDNANRLKLMKRYLYRSSHDQN